MRAWLASGWAHVVAAVLGVGAHIAVSLVLALMLLSEAYSFARSFPDGGQVSSYDELYKLGESPRLGFTTLAIVGLIEAAITLVLLLLPSTRRWAWVVPILGIAASIVVQAVAITNFEPPPPDLGG